MCSQATRLLAVCVMCVVRLTPTVSQCTTKYCSDDDNDVGALTAMLSRLQNTEERLEQQHQQYLHSLEEQREYVIELENTMKEKISTLEQGGVIYIFHTGCSFFSSYLFLHRLSFCIFYGKSVFFTARQALL